jgi:hypothetical protein
MIIEGIQGIQALANGGTQARVSIGRFGDQYVSDLMPRYGSLVAAGMVNFTTVAAVTIASTHVSPLPANTGTPIISIGNPASNNKNFIVLGAGLTGISGTPGGPYYWNTVSISVITAAANGTILNALAGNPATSSAKCWNNTAITGSAAGVLFANAFSGSAGAVTNGGVFMPGLNDNAGMFGVAPGTLLVLAAAAAGTSPIVTASIAWIEVPV